MNKKEQREIKYDYYALKGFIYGNRKLKNLDGLAKFLGVANSGINDRIENRVMFSQDMIYKIMVEFELTPQQVVDYFFTIEEE